MPCVTSRGGAVDHVLIRGFTGAGATFQLPVKLTTCLPFLMALFVAKLTRRVIR